MYDTKYNNNIMRFTKHVLAAYVYACLDGNRVAASPLSAAISKITFDESQTSRRRMEAFSVTCKFTIDNAVHDVWLDGVKKNDNVTGGGFSSYGALKTLTFDDSAGLLAISGKDNEQGCINGGFSIWCSSENTSSKWNLVNSVGNRKDWLVASNRGGYRVSGVDANGYNWYTSEYTIGADFGTPLEGSHAHVHHPEVNGDMCGVEPTDN